MLLASCLDKINNVNNVNSKKINVVEPTLESLSENFALSNEGDLHCTRQFQNYYEVPTKG